jgi:hypothetical protein
MKKAAIVLLTMIFISSCSLFEKPSMTQEEIDALVNQKAGVEEELANLQQQYDLLKIKADECARMLEEQTKVEEVKGNFLVIAGSFKNMDYANEFSVKIKQMGGAGNIVSGPYNFNLVVYSSHTSLSEAANSMYLARTNVSEDAWVYMQK